MMTGWTHHEISIGDTSLHYVAAGEGTPVVLLHGFPEFWYSWRHQLPALADAGFRALAVDLRGYNASSRPRGVQNYRTAALVGDVAALIMEVAGGSAHVVGHDWGGVLAWRLASLRPELVRKLAILNAPHPAAYREELKRNPLQWLRSWYVLFFQLPWAPEQVIRAGDFKLFERAWRHAPARREAFAAEEVAEYKKALGGSRGVTGPVNYYRAAMRHPKDVFGPPQTVSAPTLVIWGCRDPYLSEGLSRRLDKWVGDLRVERIPEASHWVQNDSPDEVNRLLIDFFGGSPKAAPPQ